MNNELPAAPKLPDASEASIESLRRDIDFGDEAIIQYARFRTRVSRTIGDKRRSEGGDSIDPEREEKIAKRYEDALGPGGRKLAQALLELGRGVIADGEDS